MEQFYGTAQIYTTVYPHKPCSAQSWLSRCKFFKIYFVEDANSEDADQTALNAQSGQHLHFSLIPCGNFSPSEVGYAQNSVLCCNKPIVLSNKRH